jgi:hypothetical protein
MNTNNTNNTNQCLRCMKCFPNQFRLKRHINGARTCKISILGGQDLTKIQLLQGLEQQQQTQTIIYKCDKCNKIFDRPLKLERHKINCQGNYDFMTEKLKLYNTHRGYTKLKYYIRAVFYSTYIGTDIKYFKKAGKFYYIYEEGKWSKNRYSKYTLMNKVFNRLRRDIKPALPKSLRDICEYYYRQNITSAKELNSMEQNAIKFKYFGKFFFRTFLSEIEEAIQNGKYTNIYGFIPYDDYQKIENQDNVQALKEWELEKINNLTALGVPKKTIIEAIKNNDNSILTYSYEENLRIQKEYEKELKKKKEAERRKQISQFNKKYMLFKKNEDILYDGIEHLIKRRYDMTQENDKEKCFYEISKLLEEWEDNEDVITEIYDTLQINYPDLSFYSIFRPYGFLL